jgi:hypothetical protein
MGNPELAEQLAKLVQQEADLLRALNLPGTTVSVDRRFIRLSRGDRVFIVERMGKDSFLIITEDPTDSKQMSATRRGYLSTVPRCTPGRLVRPQGVAPVEQNLLERAGARGGDHNRSGSDRFLQRLRVALWCLAHCCSP